MAKWYLENMTFTVDVPDTMLRALDVSPAEASAKLRLAAAMKFYELGELSSGARCRVGRDPEASILDQAGRLRHRCVSHEARGIGPGHRVSPAS